MNTADSDGPPGGMRPAAPKICGIVLAMPMPAAHQKRWGAGFRSSQRRKTMGAKNAASTVVEKAELAQSYSAQESTLRSAKMARTVYSSRSGAADTNRKAPPQ